MLNKQQFTVVRDIFVSGSPLLVSIPFTLNGLTKFDENEPKALLQPPGYVFGIVWPMIYLSLFSMNFLFLNDKNISNYFKNIIIKDTLIESFLQGLWLYNFRYKNNIKGRTKGQYWISSINMFMLVFFGINRIFKFLIINDSLIWKYVLMYVPYFSWINFANILSLQLFLGYIK